MNTAADNDFNIRIAESGDRSAIVALWGEVFPNPPPHNDPGDDIDRKLAKDAHLFLVAEATDTDSGAHRVVGSCMAGWDGHRGFVWYVGVLESHQRRGIGAGLMQRAEQLLWQQGCRKLNLMIRSGNERVINFYRKLGYQSEDRVCMGKLLNQANDLDQSDLVRKAQVFRKLHEHSRAFVMPNPWDLGSSKILQSLGFEALATTSAGFAFSHAVLDGSLQRDQVLNHCRQLATHTTLPVSADLESGFATSLEQVAQTYTLAGETGLVGASIEDTTGNNDNPIHDFDVAVARVEAAIDSVRKLPFPFVLTARAENYLHGKPDIADTIRRLQAFEALGADVLYAPGLKSLADIRDVCSSVSKPVNVVIGGGMSHLSVESLSRAGVRRISLGSSFARVAIGALVASAEQILKHGQFDLIDAATEFKDVKKLLQPT